MQRTFRLLSAAHRALPAARGMATKVIHEDVARANLNSVTELPSEKKQIHMKEFSAFKARLGVADGDTHDALLLQALTHESADKLTNNQRLALLGDFVVQQVVLEWLYVRFPSLPAEALRTIKRNVANDVAMASVGKRLGVNAVIVSGEDLSRNAISSPSAQRVIAGATRSIIGALHLSAGSQAARTLVRDMALAELEKIDIHEHVVLSHPKQTLKFLLAAKGQPAPVCRIVRESGRNTHFPTFVVGVFSGDRLLGEGSGWSIKNAENEAAKTALMTHYGRELRNTPLPSEQEAYRPEADISLMERK